jgi:hypothetical protein
MLTFENVTYKIINFDEAEGRITVIYDELAQLQIIDLYLTPTGLYPSDKELDEYIRMMCPIHIINRRIVFADGIPNSEEIKKLVTEGPAPIIFPPVEPLPF